MIYFYLALNMIPFIGFYWAGAVPNLDTDFPGAAACNIQVLGGLRIEKIGKQWKTTVGCGVQGFKASRVQGLRE